MANFFTKPFARSKKRERENSQRGLPLGKEPARLKYEGVIVLKDGTIIDCSIFDKATLMWLNS